MDEVLPAQEESEKGRKPAYEIGDSVVTHERQPVRGMIVCKGNFVGKGWKYILASVGIDGKPSGFSMLPTVNIEGVGIKMPSWFSEKTFFKRGTI
jgi:hypothetical protein